MSQALVTCICGSSKFYAECCGPLHDGVVHAPTAEALMRSRYSAYVLGKEAYLLETWHASTRPVALNLAGPAQPDWKTLRILNSVDGNETSITGMVEFVADCLLDGKLAQMHECSQFCREEGRWYYLDGKIGNHKLGRNQPCPCDSGKKYKYCCGR